MMSSSPDNTVHGGLELPSLAAISHATDEQKNRGEALERRNRRRKRKKQSHTPVDDNDIIVGDVGEDEDENKPQVNYLA